jgi:hypothetical protein
MLKPDNRLTVIVSFIRLEVAMRIGKLINRSLGVLLLGIWLIATGLAAFIPAFRELGPIPALLAIAAGILLVLSK